METGRTLMTHSPFNSKRYEQGRSSHVTNGQTRNADPSCLFHDCGNKWSPKWSPTSGNGEGGDGNGRRANGEFANQIKLGGMRWHPWGWLKENYKTAALPLS